MAKLFVLKWPCWGSSPTILRVDVFMWPPWMLLLTMPMLIGTTGNISSFHSGKGRIWMSSLPGEPWSDNLLLNIKVVWCKHRAVNMKVCSQWCSSIWHQQYLFRFSYLQLMLKTSLSYLIEYQELHCMLFTVRSGFAWQRRHSDSAYSQVNWFTLF